MNRRIYLILGYIAASLLGGLSIHADESSTKNTNYCTSPKSLLEFTIITNTGFTIGYSESYKNPLWVSYRLFPVANPVSPKRPSKFKVDKRTQSKVKHDDYTHTGYDRGHMAPNYAIVFERVF